MAGIGAKYVIDQGLGREAVQLAVNFITRSAVVDVAADAAIGVALAVEAPVVAIAAGAAFVIAVGYYGGKYISEGGGILTRKLYNGSHSVIKFFEKEYYKWI